MDKLKGMGISPEFLTLIAGAAVISPEDTNDEVDIIITMKMNIKAQGEVDIIFLRELLVIDATDMFSKSQESLL